MTKAEIRQDTAKKPRSTIVKAIVAENGKCSTSGVVFDVVEVSVSAYIDKIAVLGYSLPSFDNRKMHTTRLLL